MDWQPTRVNFATFDSTASVKRYAKWVSRDEIAKRRQNGLCLRCGASGHMVRTCPHLPPRRPQSADSVRVAATIKAKLQCIDLPNPKILLGVEGIGMIQRAAHFTYDIEGWTRTGWAYVVEKSNTGYDILFGRSWFDKH
ncbi:hypothetical protein M011DRAFT_379131, partial [Sporormia fimetaria CBS 119925]